MYILARLFIARKHPKISNADSTLETVKICTADSISNFTSYHVIEMLHLFYLCTRILCLFLFRIRVNSHSRLPVGDQPRGILSWVANTARSSYYMLNVNGHNLYRLNYPLRLNKWYHSCQSWNGRTGEWQIWVNDERVGRGFNNRVSTTLCCL